ncbi:hypothetical protein Desaci_1443 [Desulfosporosinus acidiphilus SJ4]|uniref:Uncharacterized protein n=1 Tax=Desulfosporosinus acidiphilus (strain DSM 22704 / JCM 16185 / SJ4) TaxID=646529 RepID=I4D3T6_DESAJ|nr:hypothetical protein [Desulfosporosinus acidiphilus]AFM40460.1 hypothetical protein Desaci_1443 [Desulfosporosinus acidiphilus SJ4]
MNLSNTKDFKALNDHELGSVSQPVLVVALLAVILVTGFIWIALKLMAVQRANVETWMQSLLKDSIQTAVAVSIPQGVTMDNSALETTVIQLYAQKLKVTTGSLAVQTFTVYGDNDAGLPAPPGVTGTIPGRSVYVSLQVTWTMPPVMGISYTGTYPVCDLVALPTYFAPSQQWN